MILAFLLFFSAFTYAGDAFVPPPAELTNTKYARDCGGEFPDITSEMPPVDDQRPSPWCATFATKAVIDHFYHSVRNETTYRDRISANDLNSWNSDRPEAVRGLEPDFLDAAGANASGLLEGVQRSGKIYLESDLPFDQSYFDSQGTLARLSDYYERQKDFVGDPGLLACRDQSPASIGLEKEFSELVTVLSQSLSKEAFFAKVGQGRILYPLPRAGAERRPLNPGFNIQLVRANTGDQYAEEIQQNLLNHRPTLVAVCALQMMQIPGLADGLVPVSPAEKNNCGGHYLTVVGMENMNGECRLKVRNSWGENWPTPTAGGYASIPLTAMLKISHGNEMTSIVERKEGRPVENHIQYAKGMAYFGETLRRGPNGRGILREAGRVSEGVFADWKLVEGRQTWKDGSYLSGKFSGDNFVEGTMKRRLSDGTEYEGEFKNSMVDGKGKMKKPDGSVAEGIFKAGRFMTGTFKGLINPEKGIYYNGPMKDGQTTDPTKFTDKNGKPWVF
ncbi:MAG: hypothetical protein AB7K68_02550 [Bacteriovoracia bacterium]